jgi:hypothetical protein
MPRPWTTLACQARSSGFRRTPRSALTVVVVFVGVEEVVVVGVVGLVGELLER